MKRFFYVLQILFLVLFSSLLLCSCKSKNCDFCIPETASFTVEEETEGIVFKAILNGDAARLTFLHPAALNGLEASTAGSGTYNLCYNGRSCELGTFSVKNAADFIAALKLLKCGGTCKGSHFTASADSLYADAEFENGSLKKIVYFDGMQKKIYKIDMEE